MQKESSITNWETKNKELLRKMDEWRESYTCDKNCWEWQRWRFCQHLRKARAREFNQEIEMQMEGLIIMNSKLVFSVENQS